MRRTFNPKTAGSIPAWGVTFLMLQTAIIANCVFLVVALDKQQCPAPAPAPAAS